MPITADRAIAVIGGSGLYHLEREDSPTTGIATPFAPEPVVLHREECAGVPLWFLPRHGRGHPTPPHRVNYRANIDALYRAGARRILAVNAVGALDPSLEPGNLAVPDQLIDYTWGREHTFHDGLGGLHDHADFAQPYCPRLRRGLIESCHALGIGVREAGVYGCTQGPRLETVAEIRRMRGDGCDLVGMTGMPEAALARELGMAYASLCLVVNPAAGVGDGAGLSIAAIQRVLVEGMGPVRTVLRRTVATLAAQETPA